MEKIARICWNDKNWRYPSGREGKSKAPDSYENKFGFGHEEWLLDDRKIMPDGYHYAFLQGMNVGSRKHDGQIYDIHLYTVSPNKKKVYVGCFKNAIGVTSEEREKVFAYYQEHGWIDEIKQEIIFVDGKPKDIAPQWLFNVKFKFSEAEINYSNQPMIKFDSISHRYKLLNKNGDFDFERDEEGNIEMYDSSLFSQPNKTGEINIDPIYKRIQKAVAEILKDEYASICLKGDGKKGNRQRVDIIGKKMSTEELHYFEIKTYSTKRSIREALGQILEYNHYPSESRARKLIVVGPEKPDKNDCEYLKTLRNTYNLPIWFRWYSFEENKLYEAI